MMKKLQIIAVLVAVLGWFEVVDGGCCGGGGSSRRPPDSPARRSASASDVTRKVDRLLEDAEDAERRLSRVKAGSRDEMIWNHRRETIALQIIHEAQSYFLDQKTVKDDGRTRKMRLLLQNESAYLQRSLADVRDFPYLDRLENAQLLIGEIRSGKVRFPDRVSNNDSVLLREIQKLQRDFLEEYHRRTERDFRK